MRVLCLLTDELCGERNATSGVLAVREGLLVLDGQLKVLLHNDRRHGLV